MKKRNRRMAPAAAVFLSLTCLAGHMTVSYGAVEVESSKEVRFPVESVSHEVETELKGQIDVALISVTLPSDVEFKVNPLGNFSLTTPGGQITNPEPDKFIVTNHSAVPVQLEIASVEDIRPEDVSFAPMDGPGRGPEQKFQLVDRISQVNAYGTAILVLGKASQTYGSEADFERYAICPGKTGITVAESIAAESSVELQVYGKVMADFYGEYQFTVRPTLKISAVRGD